MSYQLRPVNRADYTALRNFINAQNFLHRHLDWRDALEWLGRQPFFVLEDNHTIGAVLACPPEPANVAWVRLFGVTGSLPPDPAWKMLFAGCVESLKFMQPHPTLVSLGLRDWFSELLLRNGFHFHQDIVVFVFDEPAIPPPPKLDSNILLREMRQEDLHDVGLLDNVAFEPIWQLSASDLDFAFLRSAYNTVAEIDGEIVAYQMSSSSGFYAHLARLAVNPSLQRRRLGFALVQNLLEYFMVKNTCWGVTLNTQHNNTSSIALYHRLGFHETGERFPVYAYEY